MRDISLFMIDRLTGAFLSFFFFGAVLRVFLAEGFLLSLIMIDVSLFMIDRSLFSPGDFWSKYLKYRLILLRTHHIRKEFFDLFS